MRPFEALHEAARLRDTPRERSSFGAIRLELHHRDMTFLDTDVNIDCFERGFMCYELILYVHYLEIGPTIRPLILVNASIEERIEIIGVRRERLWKELESCYASSLFQ